MTSRWPARSRPVEDVGQDGPDDRGPAQAVVKRLFSYRAVWHRERALSQRPGVGGTNLILGDTTQKTTGIL